MGRRASGTTFEKPAGSGRWYFAFLLRDRSRHTERVPEHPGGAPLTKALADEFKAEAMRRYALGLWDPKAPKVPPPEPEPALTVAAYAQRWATALDHGSSDNERRCVEQRIAPSALGAMALAAVRPPDVAAWVAELGRQPSDKGGLLAPVTVLGFLGVLRRMYVQACFEGLATSNPTILPRGKVPRRRDKVPGARETWRFYREEIVELVSDVRVPLVRRVVYTLLFLTGMRASELSVLRWVDYDPRRAPLGCLTLARAMKVIRPKRSEPRRRVVGGTKTEVAKLVPVHPTLAAVLAEWKLGGWPKVHGKKPTDDDLIVPTRKNTPRLNHSVWKALQADCARVGIRARRLHGARHTFISLATDDGARGDLIKLLTHPRPTGPGEEGSFGGYRHVAWETLCAEVMKIRVLRRGDELPLWKAASGGGGGGQSDSATHSATDGDGCAPSVGMGSVSFRGASPTSSDASPRTALRVSSAAMSTPRRLRSAALALVLAASLPQCASTPAPAPVTPVANATNTAVEVAVDNSPVTRPTDNVVSIRVGTVRGTARRLGEMLGPQMSGLLDELITTQLPEVLGDEGAARVVDLDGPLDLVVAFRDNDVEGIAAFPVRSLANARAQLSDGHTLESFGNPSLRIQRIRRPEQRGTDDLFLLPTAGEGGRLLMVHRREGYEDFINRYAAYIARTLAAQPLTSDDGAVVVEFHPQVIEQSMRGDLDSLAAELVDAVAPGPDPNNPQFADAARQWLRDAVAALRTTVTEARDARLSLSLPDTGAALTVDLSVQNPSAQLAQQALAAVRDSPVPVDLYDRLPPGAWTYGAWAMHTEPLRATLNLAASAAARALTPRTRLVEADATALRTALGALVAQDRVAVATATQRDAQDRYTATALLRLSTPSPQFVANVRALVTTMRRPAVARAINADLHINPMGWTLPPTTGLPAGSLLLRGTVPTRDALMAALRAQTTAARPGAPGVQQAAPGARPPAPAVRGVVPAAPAARPVVSELLLVPEGDHVWVVLGANARTQFAAATAAHPAPPTIPDAAAAGTSSVAAILPNALLEIAHNDPTLGRTIRETLAGAGDAANAPSIGRLRTTEREGVTHVTADLTVPRAALGLVGRSVQRALQRP